MYVKQIYTGCLSEAAYFIESDGEAAVIDPLRDVEAYLDMAKEKNARIKYIFETHFHADFISGHIDLAKATGADIIYGPGTETNFDVIVAEDGKDHCVFTGDTLFVGDVGRPDLAQKGADLTMEDLAGMLYDSLQQKIIPLA